MEKTMDDGQWTVDGKLSLPLVEFIFLVRFMHMYTPCSKLTKCYIRVKHIKGYGSW